MKKKFLTCMLMAVIMSSMLTSVVALEPRGPILPPETKSTSKYCKYGTKKLFKLNHSAYFTPGRLGVTCSVTNHEVKVSNIASGVGIIIKSKTVEDDGFRAKGRAQTNYKKKLCIVYTQLDY